MDNVSVPVRGLKLGLLGFFGSVAALISSWLVLSFVAGPIISTELSVVIGLVLLLAFGASAFFFGVMVAAWTRDYGAEWLQGE